MTSVYNANPVKPLHYSTFLFLRATYKFSYLLIYLLRHRNSVMLIKLSVIILLKAISKIVAQSFLT